MTVIAGVGYVSGPGAAPRRPKVSGFVVPEEGTPGVTITALGVMLPDLVALQEAGQATVQDREARRHGRAMLDALTALQRALLTGTPDSGTLRSLAGMLRRAPLPADPALADAQRMILVRVAVELAREAAAASA